MMTDIGDITVGTLLKRVEPAYHCITTGKIYEVVSITGNRPWIINDGGVEWDIWTPFYQIVGHVDDDIIQELDQILELCLKYNELENYILKNA